MRFHPTRRLLWWMCGVGVVALVIADQRGWLLVQHTDDMQVYHGRQAQVLRIIDGDTLEIDQSDHVQDHSATRIRLCGIDCPETAKHDRIAEPWAQQAIEFARNQVNGYVVTLTLESHRTRDKFGRLLAHVELEDGRNLNETLLDAGLAQVDERWPHTRLSRYAQVERSARRRAVGLWSPTD